MAPTLNPQRETTARLIAADVSMLSKILMSTVDGQQRWGRNPPTAVHVAYRIRRALREKLPDPTLGAAYHWDGLGLGLREYLGMAVAKCDEDLRPSCDLLAREYYQRCADFFALREAEGDPLPVTAENVANVAAQVIVLDWEDEAGDLTGFSLWAFMMNVAYRDHPRTPGGTNWNPNVPHATSPNFWAGVDPLAAFKV